jgi:hypothetical protein
VTCEEALAQRHQLSSNVTSLPRNMTGSAYGALLNGTGALELLRDCTPGTWRRADLCVAVEGVTAVGVTVRTTPADDSVERCMSGAIAALTFSHQDNLQVLRTSVTVTPKRR